MSWGVREMWGQPQGMLWCSSERPGLVLFNCFLGLPILIFTFAAPQGKVNNGPEVLERAKELVKRMSTSPQLLFVLGLSDLPNVGSHSCSPCPLPQADAHHPDMWPPSWAPYSLLAIGVQKWLAEEVRNKSSNLIHPNLPVSFFSCQKIVPIVSKMHIFVLWGSFKSPNVRSHHIPISQASGVGARHHCFF